MSPLGKAPAEAGTQCRRGLLIAGGMLRGRETWAGRQADITLALECSLHCFAAHVKGTLWPPTFLALLAWG